eukprot:TRINITY_DN3855_c0_g1_i1.p1 TRINITY_DN3855_c0_g1~~TRINITY_DN3855_c0_g1_i1.p1  ORF type:complete len:625 (-),score=149.81 TRINITY_DN3855_c0_g1_i1:540-2414(-)
MLSNQSAKSIVQGQLKGKRVQNSLLRGFPGKGRVCQVKRGNNLTGVMQTGQGVVAQSAFQQIIEESEPICADLKIQEPETTVTDITKQENKMMQMNKLDKKAKKQERKKQKMEKINDCNEEDYDSDSDSEDEEEECTNGEMKKMEMKKKEGKKEKDKAKMEKEEECRDKEGKKEKKKMKKETEMKQQEMEMKQKEMEVKQTEADQEMVDRQQKLFDKVVQMWEDDRKAWIEREKVLLEQIRFLQSLTGKEVPVSKSKNSTQELNESESEQEFDFLNDIERAMSQRSQESDTQSIGDTMQVKIPNTGEELARAMGMVSETDVLQDLDQYKQMPKRGQTFQQPQQQQQQASQQQTDDEVAAPVVKETPSGPPPTLALDSDDIFWVNQLQAALLSKGYYCGEDEMEDWFFGEQTQTALLTFQACSNLPETGTADEPTWKALLGEDLKPIVPKDQDTVPETPSSTTKSNSGNGQTEQTKFTGSKEVVLTTAVEEKQSIGNINQNLGAVDGWPVLMEGDGGKEVHALQVSLGKQGFYCGGEDIEWWQFGSTTVEALKSFQECNKLPVSGVSDSRCWKVLLGENAKPSDIPSIQAGDDSDQDMSDMNGRIWLMGEQRWSEPQRLQQNKTS